MCILAANLLRRKANQNCLECLCFEYTPLVVKIIRLQVKNTLILVFVGFFYAQYGKNLFRTVATAEET